MIVWFPMITFPQSPFELALVLGTAVCHSYRIQPEDMSGDTDASATKRRESGLNKKSREKSLLFVWGFW